MELATRTTAGDWDRLLGRESSQAPETGFVLLIERQSRFVFRVAYAVLRNVEDAEDVVQDTFLKLFRTGAWKHMEDEKAFLARVAWRFAIGKKPMTRAADREEQHEIACDEFNPERSAIETERSRTIHRLIDALPEKWRRPLALSSLDGMSTAHIAVVMGLPEGTVRRRLSEARTLIKEKLARMEGGKHA